MKQYLKYFLTGTIVVIAIMAVMLKYRNYINNPWTRDGQVCAEVIQLTPRVSGPIISLPIKDNQFVKSGDLLFAIDPRTFQVDLDQAHAQLDETRDSIKALAQQVAAAKSQVEVSRSAITQAYSTISQNVATILKEKAQLTRKLWLRPLGAVSQMEVDIAQSHYDVAVQQKHISEASLRQAKSSLLESQSNLAEAQAQLGAFGANNSQLRAAQATVDQAELSLEFTSVRAPTNGYVTNLDLREGSQAVANQPALALVDVSSYWIDGYFKENSIAKIQAGDRAIVTLMTYPKTPIEGYVESVGWGIAQQDGSTSYDLLPTINPTFEWIRLAQRVPVRVHLKDIPSNIKLRVGTTCSVLVITGENESGKDSEVPGTPILLQ